MKTMYKGVLTVAAATVIASAAIMITGTETKAEQDTAATSTEKSKASEKAAQNNTTANTTENAKETVEAGGAVISPATTTTDKAESAEKAEYPAPPPGPFAVKKEKVTMGSEAIEKPTGPVKPVGMEVPIAPVAPTAVAIDEGVTAKPTTTEASTSINKALNTPLVEPKTAEAAVADTSKVEIVETEEKATIEATSVTPAPTAPEEPVAEKAMTNDIAIEGQVSDKKTVEVKAPNASVEVQAPKKLNAVDLKVEAPSISTEIQMPEKPKATELKQPDAPVAMPAVIEKPKAVELENPKTSTEIQPPKQPEAAVLTVPKVTAPEVTKTEEHFPKTNDVPQEQVNIKAETPPVIPPPVMPLLGGQQSKQPIAIPRENKNSNQQPVQMQMMAPPTMMMPPTMMSPPQGMVAPNIVIPPQMMNRQRVIMVPVYPMNMGRPMYPYGYQMPPAGMKPQGNTQQNQPAPATPNEKQEKAVADNVGK